MYAYSFRHIHVSRQRLFACVYVRPYKMHFCRHANLCVVRIRMYVCMYFFLSDDLNLRLLHMHTVAKKRAVRGHAVGRVVLCFLLCLNFRR